MENNIDKSSEVKLAGIEIIDYSIHAPADKLPENLTFRFELKIEQQIYIEKKIIFSHCSILIFCAEHQEQLGHIRLGYTFEISNLAELATEKVQTIQLPDSLTTTLNSITVSTSRGILFTLFRGTFLQNAILPIINMNNANLPDNIQHQKTN